MKISRIALAILGSSLAFTSAAFADEAANVQVSATVNTTCTITGGNLEFGQYDTLDTNPDFAQLALRVACTQGTTNQIELDEGTHAAAGSTAAAPARRLDGANGDFLSYDLYTDAGRTDVWGGGASSNAYAAADADEHDSIIYGKITERQDVVSGTYTDTVIATILF